tara:strand:+ start:39 stop:467 length:429 start_codon:yes stop_codon:yes gene_type:complete
MAITVTEQVLANTDRKLVIKRGVTIGGTENESAATVLDISAAAYNSSGGKTMTGVAIERIILQSINIASDNLTVFLLWDADTDVRIITSNEVGAGVLDVDVGSEWGGLTAQGTNPTGDIFVTTANGTAGEGYDLILVMRKIF